MNSYVESVGNEQDFMRSVKSFQHDDLSRMIVGNIKRNKNFYLEYIVLNSLLLRMDHNWTREQYKKWVRDWKKVYDNLTRISHSTKSLRSRNRIIQIDPSLTTKNNSFVIESNIVRGVLELKVYANILMKLRKTGKILAEQAYQKSKQEQTQATE